MKPENHKTDRKDRRLAINQSGKRRCVVIMRRNGKALPFVFDGEADGLPAIANVVRTGSTVYANEASCWNALHARFAAKRINHGVAGGQPSPAKRGAVLMVAGAALGHDVSRMWKGIGQR